MTATQLYQGIKDVLNTIQVARNHYDASTRAEAALKALLATQSKEEQD